ncbi:MAG: hypothetical protein LBS75_08100, partial [Synergistaceae bacterium]|nr:hypothetical protein [Synergistaceae bacterium]
RILYDNGSLWCITPSGLDERAKDGEIKKSYTTAQLGDTVHRIAAFGNNEVATVGGDDDAKAVASGDINSLPRSLGGYVEIRGDILVAKTDEIKKGLGTSKSKEINSGGPILPQPVVSADVGTGEILRVTFFDMPLEGFSGVKVSDIAILKLKPGTGTEAETDILQPVYTASGLANGKYILLDESDNPLEKDDSISANKRYNLTVAVKDNGAYDWNAANGGIVDPIAIAKRSSGDGGGDGDGGAGGCYSGAGGAVLLALAGAFMAARRGR